MYINNVGSMAQALYAGSLAEARVEGENVFFIVSRRFADKILSIQRVPPFNPRPTTTRPRLHYRRRRCRF